MKYFDPVADREEKIENGKRLYGTLVNKVYSIKYPEDKKPADVAVALEHAEQMFYLQEGDEVAVKFGEEQKGTYKWQVGKWSKTK